MKVGVSIKSDRAIRALEKAGGDRLSKALLAGYRGAARVIRDKAKMTTAFTDRTGAARKSWKITASRKRFLHAKLTNYALSPRGAPYVLFLEREPLDAEFIVRAVETTESEQVKQVRSALRKHLLALRSEMR